MDFIFPTWSHPALYSKDSSINGTGLFTSQALRAGETIIVWGGVLVPYAMYDESKHKARATTAYDEKYCLTLPLGSPDSVDEFINHACDPNTWMADERTVVARKDIEAGKEITTDFALWCNEDYLYAESCGCATALCRGRVTGRDWRIPELQQRYRGHFQPFINRLMGVDGPKRRRHPA
jgi:hypothetical protein